MNAMNRFATDQGYNTGGMNPNYGSAYNPNAFPKQKPRMTNPLSEQQIQILSKSFSDEFNLKVTEEEMAKAICTHKYCEGMPGVSPSMYGQFATVPVEGEPGMMYCKICHTKFNPDIVTPGYVEDMVEKYHNVIETCKLMGLDLHDDVIKQYFSMTPYVERLPKLFHAVAGVFDRYNMGNPLITDGAVPNFYGMYNYITNPSIPIGPGYGYGAPQMMGQPGFGQPMMQTPMMGMQNSMVGGVNPFYAQPNQQMMGGGYGAPQMMGQPMYGQAQQQQPPMNPPTPQMNNNGGTVEIKEQVNL